VREAGAVTQRRLRRDEEFGQRGAEADDDDADEQRRDV